MYKDKLVQFLKTLPAKELKELKKYIESPFHNNNRRDKVLQLFDCLYAHHSNDFTHSKLQEINVFETLFPHKNYESKRDKQQFSNIKNQLMNLVKDFLLEKKLQADTSTKNRLWLEVLFERKLLEQLQSEISSIKNQYESQPTKQTADYQNLHLLQEFDFAFNIVTKGRATNSNFQAVADSFDAYFIVQKLKYFCVMLNEQLLTAVSYEFRFADELLGYLEESPYTEIPLVKLYRLLMLFLKEEKEGFIGELKEGLQLHREDIAKGELRQIYTCLINYYNTQLTSGKTDYSQAIFEVYQLMVEQEIIYTNDFITPPVHFINIIRAAIYANQLKWAKDFYESNQDKMRTSQASLKVYAKAVLQFHQQEFQATIDTLQAYKHEQDFWRYKEHKVLLIKAYYELDDDEQLLKLLTAFKQYLLRHKDSTFTPHFLQVYQAFIASVEGLYALQTMPVYPVEDRKNAAQKLKEDIEGAKHIAEKKWLGQKVGEFLLP
ncbi:MAG: hypothetical protein R3E32_29650 [Chitinophagales bacterium]